MTAFSSMPSKRAGRRIAAGLRQGDLVVRVAATEVSTVDELAAALEGTDPDAAVEVLVVRGADELTLAVDLGGRGTAHEGSA